MPGPGQCGGGTIRLSGLPAGSSPAVQPDHRDDLTEAPARQYDDRSSIGSRPRDRYLPRPADLRIRSTRRLTLTPCGATYLPNGICSESPTKTWQSSYIGHVARECCGSPGTGYYYQAHEYGEGE